MADRAHSTGRRALLAGLGATTLMYLPVYANGVSPDADLLALEPEFTRRHSIYIGHRDAFNQGEEDASALAGARGHDESFEVWFARFHAAQAAVGLPAFEDAMNKSWDALIEIYEVTHAMQARTLQGLCFKARVYRDAEMEGETTLLRDLLAIDVEMRSAQPQA